MGLRHEQADAQEEGEEGRLHGKYGRKNGVEADRAKILAKELEACNKRQTRSLCLKRFKRCLGVTDEEIQGLLEGEKSPENCQNFSEGCDTIAVGGALATS